MSPFGHTNADTSPVARKRVSLVINPINVFRNRAQVVADRSNIVRCSSSVGEGTTCSASTGARGQRPFGRGMQQQEHPLPPPPPPTLPCLQAFPCEPRPLCTPEEKQHLPPLKDNAIEEEGDETPGDGGEGEEGKTVRELARLCYEDPCRGLLEVTGCARQGDRGGGTQIAFCLPSPSAMCGGRDARA